MDKSYVTLAVCPICQKETGSLLLDRRLKPVFEMHTTTPEPCDNCRKKYLTKGVMQMNPDNGNLVVLKISAFKRIFDKPVPEGHIAFTDQEMIDRLTSSTEN